MNRTETSELLTLMSLVDNRAVTPEMVIVWHELLDGILYLEAVAAMKAHYRTSTKWLMPGHLVELVEQSRAEARREPAKQRRLMREWLDQHEIDWVRYEAGDPEVVAEAERARHREAAITSG